MATIKDIAQAANVNTSTVSRALSGSPKVSEETRARILKCAEELGYQPNFLAKGLRERRTRILGLVISSILNPSVTGIVRGVGDAAIKRGYVFVLCDVDNDAQNEKKYLDTLQSICADGILVATANDSSDYLLRLKRSNCPIVLLVRELEEHFDVVCVDNRQSSYKAVKYLLDTGCKDIAIVNGPQNLHLYRERFQGYCNALEEFGIARNDRLIWGFSGHTGQDFYEGTLQKLKCSPRPDAILAASGPMGSSGPHILRAVKEMGMCVPNDISIIGFDDLVENAITDPPLTIVSQPFYDIGRTATDRLIDKIENKGPSGKDLPRCATLLNTEFIVRGTTR